MSAYLTLLMPPALNCLSGTFYYLATACNVTLVDHDARVRYYACEAMYNICKVARQHAMIYFNELFDALGKVRN